MKNKLLLPLITLLIILAGCRSEDEIVADTAKKYLSYMSANKYDKLRKMSTPESKSMLDFMESMSNVSGFNEKPKPIENLYCKINNDTAYCTYKQGDDDKSLTLVKLQNKWLVDMKKESPKFDETKTDTTENNIQPDNGHSDTTTYFDITLVEARDVDGSARLTFELGNRSDYNILHLWMSLYFSDKNGNYMTKKDIMFNGILKSSMYGNISNSDEIKNKRKVEIVVENTTVSNIGEVYIYPFRLQLEGAYYDQEGDYGFLGNMLRFTKDNALIKNLTEADIKIVF